MTERHEHTHKFEEIGAKVQLPTAPIEIQVKLTYRIDDDTKAWLDGRIRKLMLFVAGVVAYAGTTVYLICR